MPKQKQALLTPADTLTYTAPKICCTLGIFFTKDTKRRLQNKRSCVVGGDGSGSSPLVRCCVFYKLPSYVSLFCICVRFSFRFFSGLTEKTTYATRGNDLNNVNMQTRIIFFFRGFFIFRKITENVCLRWECERGERKSCTHAANTFCLTNSCSHEFFFIILL